MFKACPAPLSIAWKSRHSFSSTVSSRAKSMAPRFCGSAYSIWVPPCILATACSGQGLG
jgi:hypothetical protein